jgi:hypothetical protein
VSEAAESTFAQVVQATGLPEMIANGLVRRAIKDTGGGEPPSKEDWKRALDRIEARLRAYLDPAAAKERAAAIAAIVS